ncbi:hypothetical protein Pcinc_020041 [Petrolisthes cinctipes]|uniref:Mitochondrial ribosomal protein S11 n=1 Tax=Petrolisthes cinctipes TaxID=88211 RepID=A0AAE1FIY0_PETCI|nr:hypothetical protein Pcinc_020041 [Petrolisthes cinctipes]
MIVGASCRSRLPPFHFKEESVVNVVYLVSVLWKSVKMLRRVVARGLWSGHGAVRTSVEQRNKEIRTHQDIAAKLLVGWRSCDGFRGLHVTPSCYKTQDRKEMLASMPVKDEGTEGEVTQGLDTSLEGSGGMFPDEDTPNLLCDGVRFADLPILHARVSKNNTMLTLTDGKGMVKLYRSCGVEGFKNAKKGTNIAAQATAISLATRALNQGIKTVRVKVSGIGPGRMAAVKGLTMGGLNVVSITDDTPISFNYSQRPRKARKL